MATGSWDSTVKVEHYVMRSYIGVYIHVYTCIYMYIAVTTSIVNKCTSLQIWTVPYDPSCHKPEPAELRVCIDNTSLCSMKT